MKLIIDIEMVEGDEFRIRDLPALIARADAEETGVELDAFCDDGTVTQIIREAVRALFVDPTGPAWLIHQSWCEGWMVFLDTDNDKEL